MTTMIKIEKYTSINQNEWDTFLATCKNESFLFYRRYMEYHSDRFTDYSLIIRNEKGIIIALLPANIQNHKLYTHSGLSYGGFLVNRKMTTLLMLDIFKQVIIFLKKNNIVELIYKSIPYIYHTQPAQEDLYALFKYNAKLIQRNVSSTIDLRASYQISKGRKWGINLAKKNGATIGEFHHASQAWPILKDVLMQQHGIVPVHSATEIDYLQSSFPQNIRAYYAKTDHIVAIAITYESKQVCHTQYLAVNQIGRKIAALDFLIDYLIKNCHQQYFDFGISTEQSGSFLNAGLIAYKEGFGSRPVMMDTYSLLIE